MQLIETEIDEVNQNPSSHMLYHARSKNTIIKQIQLIIISISYSVY